jgi:DNA-binding MarR family transcriptional regulator
MLVPGVNGLLQHEILQNESFRSSGQEAMLGLLRTADMVRRRIQEIVEPAGITLQQYNVLRILRGAGEKGLPTLAIARRMLEQTPGITRLIDRLEAKGWVRRERQRDDRRLVLCRIDASGLALLARLDAPVQEADAGLLEMLAEEERRQLILLLDRIREGLAKQCPGESCPAENG